MLKSKSILIEMKEWSIEEYYSCLGNHDDGFYLVCNICKMRTRNACDYDVNRMIEHIERCHISEIIKVRMG